MAANEKRDFLVDRADRTDINQPCQVDLIPTPCTLLNISESGALIEAENLPDEIFLAHEAQLTFKSIKVKGSLVRLDKNKAGFKFHGMTETQKEELEKFFKS